MSLLNDALRKRQRELKRGPRAYSEQVVPKANVKDKKRKAFLWLFFCVACMVAVLWCRDIIFPPSALLTESAMSYPSKVEAAAPTPKSPGQPSDVPQQKESPTDQIQADSEEEPVTAESVKTHVDPPGAALIPTAKVDATEKMAALTKSKKALTAALPATESFEHGLPAHRTPAKTNHTAKKARSAKPSTRSASAKGKAGPGPEAAFYKKALAYHRRGNFSKAIQMYRQVLRNDPHHQDALLNLSSAYLESHEFAEAGLILEQLYASDPKHFKVLLNLAITEMGLGRPRKALFYLNQAAEPDTGEKFEISLHKGIAFSKLEDFDQAEKCYKRAEILQPSHGRLMFNMAVLYDRLKRYNDALKYYGAFLQSGEGSGGSEFRDVKERIETIQVYAAMQ